MDTKAERTKKRDEEQQKAKANKISKCEKEFKLLLNLKLNNETLLSEFSEFINKHREPKNVSSFLEVLKFASDIERKNIYNTIINNLRKYIWDIKNLAGVTNVLKELDNQVFTQANFNKVCELKAPWSIIPVVKLAKGGEVLDGLNQKTFDIIVAYDKAAPLETLQNARKEKSDFQYDKNILTLLNLDSELLCSDWARTKLWHKLPSSVLTQDVFDYIISVTQEKVSEEDKQTKLITYREKLQQNNPKIVFKTPRMAVDRLHEIANEEAKEYSNEANQIILDKIREKVLVRISEEFSDLYPEKNCREFQGLLKDLEHINFNKNNLFEVKAQASSSAHQFHKRNSSSPLLFSTKPLSTEPVSNDEQSKDVQVQVTNRK